MKKVTPVLTVISLIAVIVLYVLHFTPPSQNTTKKIKSDSSSSLTSNTIAYINIDSVMAKYEMFKDLNLKLESKAKTSDAEFQSKQRTFQKNVQDFQNKVQKGLVTRSEAEQLQQQLSADEQDLAQLQQKLQYDFAEEQQVSYRKVLNSVIEYLKSVENDNGYQYVLGTTFGGVVLYANEALNITEEVVEGLNKAYEKSKEEK